jgi:hypothetical protein
MRDDTKPYSVADMFRELGGRFDPKNPPGPWNPAAERDELRQQVQTLRGMLDEVLANLEENFSGPCAEDLAVNVRHVLEVTK